MITLKKIKKGIKHPEMIGLYFKLKLLKLFESKTLNKGEGMDPKILKKYRIGIINDHLERYNLALSNVKSDDRVLDLACGTGYGTKLLASKATFVLGIDVFANAIEYARKEYKVDNNDFKVQSFFDVNEQFDVVVSFETIEHINADLDLVLEKLDYLAKKLLIVSCPYNEDPGRNPHHVHFNITEKHFAPINQKGDLKFFYQEATGVIHDAYSPDKNIQTIIAIRHK